jgi:hypothetical protein
MGGIGCGTAAGAGRTEDWSGGRGCDIVKSLVETNSLHEPEASATVFRIRR